MNKGYNIKIYNLAGGFEKVLPQNILMNSIAFSETVGGGQGELKLKLNLPFESTSVGYNDLVRVYESDEEHAPRLIYAGIVGKIMRVNDNSSEYLEVVVLWLASVLSLFYYRDGGQYVFSKTQSGSETVKNIVDWFSTVYPGILAYTGSSIETSASVKTDFNYTKCLEGVREVASTQATWWWAVRPDGVVHFHPIAGGNQNTLHKLQIGNNIDKIMVEENGERIVNQYFVKYNGGGVSTASDATSIAENWLRELYEDLSATAGNSSTGGILASQYVEQNKGGKYKVNIEVNSKYDIESIRAGDFVTVQNLEYWIVNLQVKKIDYNMDRVKLELEDFYSFGKEVFSS